MRKITAIVLLFPLLSSAQETIKVIKKDKDFPLIREEYYVLKGYETVKYGAYCKLNAMGDTMISGYYKDNMKDSAWREYSLSGKIMSVGAYKSGKEVGVWEYYFDRDDAVEQRYDYDRKELLYWNRQRIDTNRLYTYILNGDTTSGTLTRPLLYVNNIYQPSILSFNMLIEKRDKIKSYLKGKEGMVVISLWVDTNGVAYGHTVAKELNRSVDDEVLKAVKGIPNNWIPGLKDGRKVCVNYSLQFRFMANGTVAASL